MALDRRIAEILHYNNIFDANTIDRLIGLNGDYYEAVINGELTKLKIPGKTYLIENKIDSIESKTFVIPVNNVQPTEEELTDVIKEYTKEIIFDDITDNSSNVTDFEDKLKDIEKDIINPIKDFIDNTNIDDTIDFFNTMPIEKIVDDIKENSNFSTETYNAPVNKIEDVKEELEVKKPITKKTTTKKTTKISDNDIDDFINSI